MLYPDYRYSISDSEKRANYSNASLCYRIDDSEEIENTITYLTTPSKRRSAVLSVHTGLSLT